MTPEVAVQPVEPDSKPPLTISSVGVPALALTVRLIVVECVRLPDVPVIVTVNVPVVAAPLAVSVSVLAPVVLLGLNDAVTPLGRPDAERLTLPVKPFDGVSVIVVVALVPCSTVTLPGEAERAKSAGVLGLTVRLNVLECTKVPDVPVTVTVVVPVFAAAEAVNVNVEFALPFAAGVTVDGENAAVTPLDKPDTVRFTAVLKPTRLVIVTVSELLVPCVRVSEVGAAAVEKSGVAATFTVRLRVVVCVRLPEVPVIVTVDVPVVAVLLALSVKVLAPVVLLGLNDAVTPLGKPDVLNATLPVKPFDGAIVIVSVTVVPRVTLVAVGEADNAKSGVAAVPHTSVIGVAVAALPSAASPYMFSRVRSTL